MSYNQEPVPAWAQDIRERVVRIETKLDQYNGIREAAYAALEQAEDNTEAIRELKDDRKWLWRTVIGAMLLAGLDLLFSFRGQ